MSPMVIFGLIASVALLFAFAMLNLGKWTADSYPYQILNFIGAGFLALSALNPFNAGVFWTEVIWSALGLYGIVKIFLKRRKNHDRGQDQAPAVASEPAPAGR